MKIKYNYILGVLLMYLASSCNYLEQYPDSATNTKIDTKEKIAEVLTGAYPKTSYFRFLELRTDNVNDKHNGANASSLNEAMYYWKKYTEEDVDSPKSYWMDCFRGIAQANAALEALAKFKDKKDPEIKALYGEAFLLRAYYHFMVANIWAPTYQGPEESKKIPAIPYVESSEKHAFEKYPQLSLAEVYDKIEKDLRYGLSLVDDSYYKQPKFHFNKKAAYAFAVRFFSYVGKWQEVIDYSSYPLGSTPKNVLLAYQNWNYKDEPMLINLYSSTAAPNNLLLTSVESLWQKNYISDRYGMDYLCKERIFNRNGVKTLQQIEGYVKTARLKEGNTAYYPKFTEFLSSEGLVNPTRGHYTYNVLFTTEEIILHRMEAYAMLGEYDLALNDFTTFYGIKHIKDGVGDVESINGIELISVKDRDQIQPFYRPLTGKQASLLFVAAEISRQQFIHEGLRWFDLRRYNMSVNRNRVGEPRRLEYVLKAEDDRKTLPFPDEVHLIPFNQDKNI